MKHLILLAAFAAVAGAQPYTSPNSCPAGNPTVTTITYSYPLAGVNRTIDVEIYAPIGAPNDAVVIWSHGGMAGTPAEMRALAQTTAAACYISVSIGHRVVPGGMAWCLAVVPPITVPAECDEAVGKTYKAYDIGAVIDEVVTLYPGAPILVGGHSGGASATMLVAGADRSIGPSRLAGPSGVVQLERPEPVAFIATSPTGPNYAGFFASSFQDDRRSWDNVTRPLLTITGDGDNQCNGPSHPGQACAENATPWNRQAPHFLAPALAAGAGRKFQLYIQDEQASHTMFRLGAGQCPLIGVNKCPVIFGHITSAVVAFSDATLRAIPLARAYLQSNNITNHPQLDVAWRQR